MRLERKVTENDKSIPFALLGRQQATGTRIVPYEPWDCQHQNQEDVWQLETPGETGQCWVELALGSLASP